MSVSITITSNTIHSSKIRTESNLTDLQMLYWTGHQLRPSASHFNNAFLFTFPTAIVPNLFEQAFATAVEQYDALRTIIKEVDGVPQQQVLPKPPSPLAFVDLSHEPNSTAALILWQQQRVRLSFQPDRCLYDSVLVKLHDTHFVWFFNQHHLITDASSFFLIANNVLRKYACLLRDEHLPQEEKPAFNKYATTEQRRRASSRAEKSRIFWQEKLVNKPEQLRFYGRSRHKKSNQVRRWLHNLGPKQTAHLQTLAENADLEAATPEFRQFCFTAALYFALLHHISGNLHLGFITTIHTRSTRLARETVGPLMELCPVIVKIDPEETVVSLMQKVAAEMKQNLRHYRHGASRAASELASDVMFSFVQRPLLTLHDQPVAQEIVHPGSGSESLGLHVHHLTDSNSYQLYLDFHEDIFGSDEQEHTIELLRTLLTAVLQNPDIQLAEVDVPWPQNETTSLSQMNDVENGRSRPELTAPTTPTEKELQQVWQEVLGISSIGVHDDFFALGGDSWRAMSFLSKFEAATGQYLPLSTFFTASTIANLAQQIKQSTQPEVIVEIQPGAAGTAPLFLIPGAAGNTLAIKRLGQHLDASQPVYTFQMPEIDSENMPQSRVEELAQHYLQAIQQMQPKGPYYLGGYSAGGILAYEVAQQIRAKGEIVPYLAIIDMPAPNPNLKYWWRICHFLVTFFHLPTNWEDQVFLWGRDSWNRIIYFWYRGFWEWLKRYGRLAQHFWCLPLRSKWQRLWRRSKRGQAASPNSSRYQLRDMDPSSLTAHRSRALFTLYDHAARKYLPQPYAGQITLLRCPLGSGRKEIRSPYPHYGWEKLAGQIDTHVIQANGHLALMQEPAVAMVGQHLQNSLS